MLFTPSPLSQTVTPSWTTSPLERDVLYGRPLMWKSIKSVPERSIHLAYNTTRAQKTVTKSINFRLMT